MSSWVSPLNAWRTITWRCEVGELADRRRRCARASRGGATTSSSASGFSSPSGIGSVCGASREVQRRVAGDPVQPRLERERRPPVDQRRVGVDERLLHRVIRRGRAEKTAGSSAAAAPGSGRRSPRTPARRPRAASATSSRSSEAVSRIKQWAFPCPPPPFPVARFPDSKWDLGLLGVRPLNKTFGSTACFAALRGLTP